MDRIIFLKIQIHILKVHLDPELFLEEVVVFKKRSYHLLQLTEPLRIKACLLVGAGREQEKCKKTKQTRLSHSGHFKDIIPNLHRKRDIAPRWPPAIPATQGVSPLGG